MKEIFNKNQKVGEIAVIFPKSIEIFKKYNIDFCCGGDMPLYKALEEETISVESLLEKLHTAYEENVSKKEVQIQYSEWSSTKLIQHIVNKHHDYLREVLPELEGLIEKILRVHGDAHGETLTEIQRLFLILKQELLEHLIKEEEILFPLIMNYDENPSLSLYEKIQSTIKEIETEHEGAGDILKQLRKITNQYVAPTGTCTTYFYTYQKLNEMEFDLYDHIHLENNILHLRFQ